MLFTANVLFQEVDGLNAMHSLVVGGRCRHFTSAVIVIGENINIKESEWLFGTPVGRRQLQDSARFGRLVVAVLRRGHVFPSLDAVKDELAHSAKMLTPNGFTGQIPFLSIGNDVGRRTLVRAGCSALSGQFVVEDVQVEGEVMRRLVFLDNQFLVQSEAKLKTVKSKNKTKTVVDFGHISAYHSLMCVCAERAGGRRAVLGLGGGGLCMFLRRARPSAPLTAVELDPAVLDVALNQFDLELDDHFDVQIKDGLDFMRDEAEKGAVYAAVFYDMDSKDSKLGLSCPPPQFLEEEALDLLNKILANDGHFILNLVCRDPELHDSILDTLKRHFKHIATVKLYEEVNEIVYANNSKKYSLDQLESAVKELNTVARDRGLVKIRCIDIKDFLQSVTIVC